jgi:hypothetical protein
MLKTVGITVFVFVVAVATSANSEVLKREPAMGMLKRGQRVLVDDGRCPKGEISYVIGGDHVKVGGTQKIERTRLCIPRR